MSTRSLMRRFKVWRRQILRSRATRGVFVVGLIVVSLGMMSKLNSHFYVDPSAYTPLLNTIAKGESGGNYNAYFGNASNKSIRFTEMSVREVLDWQTTYVEQGSVSNAVGKYQIIRPTLVGLVNELHIDQDTKFDQALQDRMAIALLERRGAVEFVNDKLTEEQFAASLAKEWAALPKATGPNPEDSYYASDGINKSHISITEVYTALGVLQSAAQKKY